jgi:type IV secretory pathway VirB3-like protein
MGGVPTIGLIFVMVLGVVFLYVLKMFFMAVPIIVLYLIMRHLTARDPWMIDIVIDNISQKDVYIP